MKTQKSIQFNLSSNHKVFNLREASNLTKPSGYGPSNGLNFALNTYQAFADFRINKYSVVHISNENNAHDIFKQSYLIEPGFMYTFRIVANQVRPVQKLSHAQERLQVANELLTIDNC